MFVHLVWGTWDRLPLIRMEWQEAIYASIIDECVKLNVKVIALCGIYDHVHLLAEFPATLAVADLLKHVKGSSSHMVTHCLPDGAVFKWQGSYGAFTVSEKELTVMVRYIRNQIEHHRSGTALAMYEFT